MIFSNYSPQSYAKMYRNFSQAGILQKGKNNKTLRQPPVWASRASPAQKLQYFRVVYYNFLKDEFFFIGNSFGLKIFELFACETN